jgi:protein-S-isoprenylcysteine O-methyltransferase
MATDLTFRWVLLVTALPFLVLIHINFLRLRISRATFYHRNEPLLLAAGVRLGVVACMGGMLLYMAGPQRLHWASVSLPVGLRWFGAALLLASESLFCWGVWCLGDNFSVSLAIFDQHALVQSGPYRWVRHPMYSAVLGIGVAVFLITANYFLAGCLAFAALQVLVLRVPLEEQTLHARFGADYASYTRETGRYWPRFRSLNRARDSSFKARQER